MKERSPRRLCLAIGQLSPSIGGPYQTLRSYLRVVQSGSSSVEILAIQPRGDALPGSPVIDGSPVTYVPQGVRGISALLRRGTALVRADVVIFGVWHPTFFALSALGSVTRVLPGRGRRILVPTHSLSPYDWGKHRLAKILLAPLVGILTWNFDAIIFATHGELRKSWPRWKHNRHVVYHPMAPLTIPKRHVECSERRIAFLGRIAREKDLLLFLDTLRALPPSWSADIIGSGDAQELEGLKRHATATGCADRVTWHGWLDRSAAASVLSGASVLLVTSYGENYCHAAVEAMALSVPVVMVNRVAAAVDVALWCTGVVADADANSLAAAIMSVEEDSPLRLKVVANGRRFSQRRISGVDNKRLTSIIFGE